MRGENRKPIVSCLKLPQFTIMNVIEGQAGLVIYSSLIFYSLTIDNILNIIILIILAGVSISLVLGDNGIVTKAKEAKQNMEVAANEEQESLANLEVALQEGINEGATPPTGENGGSSTPQISASDLQAGDYIKYDTGVTSVGENGVITCRVLYEASSEYGLQIISDKNVADVTLGGSDWATASESYNSAIETLNNKAEDYLNETYARDARCVGSLPTIDTNGNFTKKDKGTETTVTLPPSTWSSYTRPNGWTSDDTGCYDTDTNYTSDGVEGVVRDKETMEALGIWTTGEYYWLASRYVYSSSSICNFYVRYVNTSGNLGSSTLCYVNSDGNTYGDSNTCGVRPCFSLKSDIKITGEDGKTGDTAYIIE